MLHGDRIGDIFTRRSTKLSLSPQILEQYLSVLKSWSRVNGADQSLLLYMLFKASKLFPLSTLLKPSFPFAPWLLWLRLHSLGFSFLKDWSKTLLVRSQEVCVTIPQRSARGLWPAPWEVVPEQGNRATHFLQGHVTTKNPPEPDKRKYSRNGFVVSSIFPQIPQGFFKEPAQSQHVYVRTVAWVLCFCIFYIDWCQMKHNWAIRSTANGMSWDKMNS